MYVRLLPDKPVLVGAKVGRSWTRPRGYRPASDEERLGAVVDKTRELYILVNLFFQLYSLIKMGVSSSGRNTERRRSGVTDANIAPDGA